MRLVVMQNVSLSEHMALSTYLRGVLEAFCNKRGISLTALISSGYNDGRTTRFTVRQSHTDLYTLLGNLKYFIWALLNLVHEQRRVPIDVIHTLYPSSSTLAALLFRTLFSRRTKVIYDIRSPWILMAGKSGKIPKYLKRIVLTAALIVEKNLIRWVDGVAFITEGLKDYYRQLGLVTRRPVHISPSGIDMTAFTPRPRGTLRRQLQIPTDSKIIGYVGGISQSRRLDFLLEAASFFREKLGPEWHLVLVGAGDYKRELMRMAEEHKLSNVHFVGPFPHDEIPHIISDIDVGICHLPWTPLFNTSFPMKILEYMACGIPVIASRIPTHEKISQELEGIFIYAFNHESFVEVSMRALNQQIDLTALTRFSWPVITDGLLDLFIQLHRSGR